MIQHLTELLFTDCEDYLHLIMQYLLVNFHIWNRPAITVRIGQQLDHTSTQSHTCTSIHSLTHSLTHPLTHIHSLTHSHPFTHSPAHSHPFTNSLISFTHSHPFTHTLTQYPLTLSFTHSLTHSLISTHSNHFSVIRSYPISLFLPVQ